MHNKWFSACTFLRYECEKPVSQMTWEASLQKLAHRPILETQKESIGFSSPFGYLAPRVMSHELQGRLYLSLTQEKKSIPRNKLNRLLMQKIEKAAKDKGCEARDIKGPERKALKEATEIELLKKTVPDEVYINFIIEPSKGLIYLDSTSKAHVKLIAKELLKLDESFKIRPFFEASLEIYLTRWVYDPRNELPRPLVLNSDATLLHEEKAKATFSNQDLESDELVLLIKHDKKVTELGLNYDGRLNFKLNHEGTIKAIKPCELLLGDVGKDHEVNSALEEREAHWLLLTHTLVEVLEWFEATFKVNTEQHANPATSPAAEHLDASTTTDDPATGPAEPAPHDPVDSTASPFEDEDDAMSDLADALSG